MKLATEPPVANRKGPQLMVKNELNPPETIKYRLKNSSCFAKHLNYSMKLIKSILLVIGCSGLISLFTGCGSIMCGRHQAINIDSKPQGAEVLIYDSRGEIIFQKTTPCVANLVRREHDYVEGAKYVVLVRKEGYAPFQFPLTGEVNRAYFANILSAGIGFVVDPMTGGMWTLVPSELDAKLLNEHASFFKPEGFTVCLKEEVPQDLVPHLKAANDQANN